MLAHAYSAHLRQKPVWGRVNENFRKSCRLQHEQNIVEDMSSRGIDVEYSYRWSLLRESLTSDGTQQLDPTSKPQKVTFTTTPLPIEALAGRIEYSDTDRVWKCLICGKNKSKKGIPFHHERDIAKHHTHKHCELKHMEWYHCPYCQKQAKLFCSIKTHLIRGDCHIVRPDELDHDTWDDIIRVNLMIQAFSEPEVHKGKSSTRTLASLPPPPQDSHKGRNLSH